MRHLTQKRWVFGGFNGYFYFSKRRDERHSENGWNKGFNKKQVFVAQIPSKTIACGGIKTTSISARP